MNDDQFLKKQPMKPSVQFTQDLLSQLHQLDEQEHEMTVYNPTLYHPNHSTHHKPNRTGVILGLIASITILFFGVSWLNTNNHYTTPTSEPLQIAPPQPEFLQQIGDYGTFVTSAFNLQDNSATIVTTTGIFKLPLDDFSTNPEKIGELNSTSSYKLYRTVQHIYQEQTVIAIQGDDTVQSINISTGDTLATWHYNNVPNASKTQSYYSHQLTADGTRYHASVCMDDDCQQKTLATWDTFTGELLSTTPLDGNFFYTDDGQILFYVEENQIIRHDLTSDEKQVFMTAENIGNFAVSPDETHVAFVTYYEEDTKNVELYIYKLEDTREPIYKEQFNYQNFYGFYMHYPDTRVKFSPDSQSLLVSGATITQIELENLKSNSLISDRLYIFYSVIPSPNHDQWMQFVETGFLKLETFNERERISNITTSSHFDGNSSILMFQALSDGVIWRPFGQVPKEYWRWVWSENELVPQSEPFPTNLMYNPVVYSNDGRYIAAIEGNVTLHIYDRETETSTRVRSGRTNSAGSAIGIYYLAFDNNNQLYLQYMDRIIRIYDIDEDDFVGTIDYGADQGDVTFTSDYMAPDRSAIAALLGDGAPTHWQITFIDGTNIVGRLNINNAHQKLSLVFSEDSQEILFSNTCPSEDCGDNDVIYRLSLTEFRQQLEEMAHLPEEERVIEHTIEAPINQQFDSVRQIRYRPNSNQIAVKTNDQILLLALNGLEAEIVYTLPAPGIYYSRGFTFSPDGDIIYIANDGYLQVWQLPSAE